MISCQFFDDTTVQERQLLKKRLQEINWQKVDKFPVISNCEVLKNDTLKKQCLFEFITQTIREKLNSNSKNKNQLDTIHVKVCISEIGKLDFETENNAELDSVVKSGLIGFPRIIPAMKQGMYVKTQFNLTIQYSK